MTDDAHELQRHIMALHRREAALNGILEDLTLNEDVRRQEFDELIIKSQMKDRMVDHLLRHITCDGQNGLPDLGSWWTAFAAPILNAECASVSRMDSTHQCFACSAKRKEYAYSLIDLYDSDSAASPKRARADDV